MGQIQFSLIKKIKIGRAEHSLPPPPPPPPPPPRPIAPHFYITHHPHPLPPFTVDVICVSLLKDKL